MGKLIKIEFYFLIEKNNLEKKIYLITFLMCARYVLFNSSTLHPLKLAYALAS